MTNVRGLKCRDIPKEVSSRILDIARASIDDHDEFLICVSGGELINTLSSGLPVSDPTYLKWKVFLVDERLVESSSSESNHGELNRKVWSPRGFQDCQLVHPTNDDLQLNVIEAALRYEERVKEEFKRTDRSLVQDEDRIEWPMFDLILLGIGVDGHVASLFPDHPQYLMCLDDLKGIKSEVTGRWIIPIEGAQKQPPTRITVTLRVLKYATNMIIVVSGRQKGHAVKLAMETDMLPVSAVNRFNPLWIVDSEVLSVDLQFS